jgi:pyruvate ferredoxin oxidoreductase gamma subunit
MISLRFHGRGGQGAKVASRILGTAAFLDGLFVQDFPLYGAERRGAPIASFVRISGEPITERGVISEPDAVIVMDETLLEDPTASPLSGLKRGGAALINSPRNPEDLRDEIGIEGGRVLTLEMTKISLEVLGEPILSTLAGAAAAKIANISEASLKEAIKRELSGIVEERRELERNVEAATLAFRSVPSIDLKTQETVRDESPVIKVPFEPALVSSPAIIAVGNSPERKTGNWRIFRPVWDREICMKCSICFARCPEGCISLDDEGYPRVNYENCKGCLICVQECPAGGIRKVRETEAKGPLRRRQGEEGDADGK